MAAQVFSGCMNLVGRRSFLRKKKIDQILHFLFEIDTFRTEWCKEVKKILDEAEAKIFSIAEDGSRGTQGFQEIRPLLSQVVERVDELYNRENKNEVTGIPTGFIDLDKMTSGLQAGEELQVFKEGMPIYGTNGEIITTRTIELGKIKITEVNDNHSIGKLTAKGAAIERGALVKRVLK